MIQKGQISFNIIIPDGDSVEATKKAIEALLKERRVTVEADSWSDLNDQFDIFGIDEHGEPWDATILAATEEDAVAQIPEGVKVDKIAPVSIFAATPGGS
jgi:hypothetical protein